MISYNLDLVLSLVFMQHDLVRIHSCSPMSVSIVNLGIPSLQGCHFHNGVPTFINVGTRVPIFA